ncbi:alpha/beta fold hydrolase [Nocardia amikacinitolerans]|uniref:alpha/beta fold hydrolase n=1 Tax=Nocardia amikacinitolerans TaxID=756689 RepID=UPI0020A3C391|nr:alpha/beta hydrolase [Nocardia amikacinitolerans]MCP2275362.1 alpha/beta hydrolase fold [Nocardia amikacinitolerans]
MRRQHHIPADTNTAWTGVVPVGDTALAVTDSGGSGIPILYVNGHVASQRNWRRVIAELGPRWRHITYDMRARGKSKTSSDYSFATNVADIDAVLAARGVERALVVGWSYGAFVAAHWTSRNPDRAIGAVLVEGAQPHDWIDEIDIEGMRKLWRRLSWVLPLLRPFGMAPRMSAQQMAESNIEVGEIARERTLGPVMDSITVATRYVNASGSSLGSKGDEQERIRASLSKVVERNPNIEIHAKVPSNHGNILRKDYRAVAEAVTVVAGLDSRTV